MTNPPAHRYGRYKILAVAIFTAVVIILSSFIIAPALKSTKTLTQTSISTRTVTALGSSNSSSTTIGLVAVVPVGPGPQTSVFDASNGDIYVPNYRDSSVSVISGATNSVVATVEVGINPAAAVFDPANGDIYVPNGLDKTVSVISGATNTVVATVGVGVVPGTPSFDSANGNLYVPNFGGNTVSVISGETNSVVANVTVGAHPLTPLFDPANGNVYVPDDNGISVISGTTNGILTTIRVAHGPASSMFDPSNGDIYIPGETDTMSVVSGATNVVVATLSVAEGPLAPAFDPTNGDIYAPGTGFGYGDTLSVISGASNTVIENLTVGGNPGTPMYDPANGNMYLSICNCPPSASPATGAAEIWVISGETNRVVSKVMVGDQPATPAFDSENGYIYVASDNSLASDLEAVWIFNPSMTTSNMTVTSTVSGATTTLRSILNVTLTSTTTVAPPDYTIVNSGASNGLEVSALIGPVHAATGQNIAITVWVSNTLSKFVTVNATGIINPIMGPCVGGLEGAEVYQGNYTASDLPSGMGLSFINPTAIYACPTTIESQISFSPNSDIATSGGHSAPEQSPTSELSGYYASSGQNYAFTQFPPGVYTVKIFDAWNQVAIGYFEITI